MKYTYLVLLFTMCFCNAQQSDFNDIDFAKADNIAKLNKDASLKNLGLLTHNLTYKLYTDVEKFRAIHSWVCQNIIGDYTQHYKVKRKRSRFKTNRKEFLKWNTKYRIKAYKKLLRYKRTMCTGYAYLIKQMAFLAGIEAEIIDGYARTYDANIKKLDKPNHSWNAVKLNGKWYLCDATWSSGYMDENSIFIKNYNDGYFLADPILFSKNHYPFEKKWLLNDALENSEFVASPLVYAEAFIHKTLPISPNTMYIETKKNTPLLFKISTEEFDNSKKISMIKTSKRGEKKLLIENLENQNGLIQFNYSFKQQGLHDVHIKVDDDIIATYMVYVDND